VLIAGGTGFLGRKLGWTLRQAGHAVSTLTRRAATSSDQITWQPDGTPGTLPLHLEGVDVVVNLAGESIAGRRWTPARKELLHTSRILPTRTLARAIAQCGRPPRIFISASGVGYYGPHGDEPVIESTPPGTDFLARLCVEWEQEARAIEGTTTRLAIVRSGLVFDRGEGALKQMVLPFKMGGGAILGSGEQYMPWIHIDDWTALVAWLIDTAAAEGAFNATSPGPVTNRTFTRTLAKVLRRPAIVRAPAFVLRLALGELSDALLTGQRALPAHAEHLGFAFTYRTLEPALESLRL
jgi:uncharacterized protein (TIGR01777 family)